MTEVTKFFLKEFDRLPSKEKVELLRELWKSNPWEYQAATMGDYEEKFYKSRSEDTR